MNASSFDQILRKVIIVPIIALLLGAAVLVWQIRTANATVAKINLDNTRVAETLLIEKLIIDEETSLRGYEITHDERFLDRYRQSAKDLPAAMDRRDAMITNGDRARSFQALRNAHEIWDQGFATPLIGTIQAGGHTDDPTLNLQGKVLMDDLRARIEALNAVTLANRDAAEKQWKQQVRRTFIAILSASALLGLLLGLYLRHLLQQVSRAFRLSHDALRVRAEQTFRSEERLRTTLESIGDGVITCDTDGLVLSLNPAAQELTGWTQADASNRSLADIFPITDEITGEPIENPVLQVTRSNNATRLQNHTMLRRPDGSGIFIENSGSPIRDKHGVLVGVVLVFRDVTVARKSQEALIATEKLAVAGRLAASIAHEIHNPLDSVANLLFLMDGVANEEERAHFLDLAQQEIARVTQISRAMLSLYRRSKNPVVIDLRETLQSILLLMDTRFKQLGVAVSHNLPVDLCVEGFPDELRQVFTNLLTNAAEAAGEGGTIELNAESVPSWHDEQGNNHPAGVLISIMDDGPGISEDIVHQLFQPFFTTKGERGTGLGLWISRGIIAKHGGTLDLESSTSPESHGTTLHVFLAAQPTINPVPA